MSRAARSVTAYLTGRLTGMAKPNPHFFDREADGSVRLRIRFNSELATLIEEAAGDTPLVVYILQALEEQARRDVAAARARRARDLPAPETGPGGEHA